MDPGMRVALATGFMVVGLTGLATNVFAAPKQTPFGLIDDSCIREFPNGSTVDLHSGNVITSGKVTAHLDKCTKASQPDTRASSDLPTLFGWQAFAEARATTISGLTQFNGLTAEWNVPAAPPASNAAVQWFFDSFENSHQACPTCGIMQPALNWGYDGQFWEAAVWLVYGCDSNGNNCGVAHSSEVRVSSGDRLKGHIHQTASDPTIGDTFYILIYDKTSGAESWGYTTIPANWAKFNIADYAVYEVRGADSCSQLAQSPATFSLINLYEAGPSWSSFNGVFPGSPNAPPWSPISFGGQVPDCGFGISLQNNSTSATLTWHN
jgi:hypothetical protein